ncbi:MAG: hypothetical protein M3P18_07220 [Actinomycetota bacterium]|nr:hypothetical protein [Actinomycetota bacterium]
MPEAASRDVKIGDPETDISHMKLARILLTGLAAVIVIGTVASASPHGVSPPSPIPAPSAESPSPSPEPSDTPSSDASPSPPASPEPSESLSAEPTKEGPSRASGADRGSAGSPDFSACAGMTGLQNAICRHEALLDADPENEGLRNSLAHLEANLVKHEKHTPPGKSGESHGQSGKSHGPESTGD